MPLSLKALTSWSREWTLQPNILIEFSVEFRRQTEHALLVFDGFVEMWLPKSQLEYDKDLDLERGVTFTVSVPEWLAEEKGLI
jgi:hypothetical protein